MNARWFLYLAAAMAPLAGCGESSTTRFVLSDRTKKLAPVARGAVDGELQKSFGEPNRLVVWRKLPVDFGDFQGTVESAPEHVSDAFNVHLSADPKTVVPFDPKQLAGAALVFTSGANVDLAAEIRGKEQPINFQVASFDPASSQLRLRVLPAEATGALTPPKKGDKFAVLGPLLQFGHKLYMQNCEHCHGVSGDGNGPTAQYFDIKPRDYRMGLFKFTSTRNTDKARRDDLERTVRLGIPGTYMPSFLLFKDDEVGGYWWSTSAGFPCGASSSRKWTSSSRGTITRPKQSPSDERGETQVRSKGARQVRQPRASADLQRQGGLSRDGVEGGRAGRRAGRAQEAPHARHL